MTGVRIGFRSEVRDEEARAAIEGLLSRLEDRLPFFNAVGNVLVGSAQENFRREHGPDGQAWKPLLPATIKARERKGFTPITILRQNSKRHGSTLAGSINYDATNDEARVGSPVEYAAIHQLGGTIQKPARQAKIYRKRDADGQIGRRFVKRSDADVVTDVTIPAHTITIPARPFLGLSAEDELTIGEIAEDWLAR